MSGCTLNKVIDQGEITHTQSGVNAFLSKELLHDIKRRFKECLVRMGDMYRKTERDENAYLKKNSRIRLSSRQASPVEF